MSSSDNPNSPWTGLEADLHRHEDLFRGNPELCMELYNALCNISWQRIANPLEVWSSSWRYAGGLAADLCEQGEDYLDYYCSLAEQTVTARIRQLLGQLGWVPTAESEMRIGKPPGIYAIDFKNRTVKRIDEEE